MRKTRDLLISLGVNGNGSDLNLGIELAKTVAHPMMAVATKVAMVAQPRRRALRRSRSQLQLHRRSQPPHSWWLPYYQWGQVACSSRLARCCWEWQALYSSSLAPVESFHRDLNFEVWQLRVAQLKFEDLTCCLEKTAASSVSWAAGHL